ncbi:hypothetical protein H0H87_007944 [Tephrocybe sp. NHM501043]|nr:hypothetical protein H0H87_007944 [Tephrocybe sp. NHM501043]
MDNSLDSSDFSFPASGSHLLSESLILPSSSSSHTRLGGDDLSLSELSLTGDKTPSAQKPFSLLATVKHASYTEDTSGVYESAGDPLGENGSDDEQVEQKRRAAKYREDKLQSDIFILRKLNASFALFDEALRDTGSANQRVALQLEQTDALLNKYIGILSKSEEFTRLIFDQQWQGAEADEETLERERLKAIEQARHDAEAKALALQQEEERRKRDEQDRIKQAEKERVEREKIERAAARGGVRGVRGTRASMRGTARGTTRPVSGSTSSTRGRVTGTIVSGTTTSKLPMPSTGVRSSTTSSSTRGVSAGRRS